MLVLVLVLLGSSGAAATAASGGLTLTHFDNTAIAGVGASRAVVGSLDGFADCAGATCGVPSSLSLTGRLAPPAAGNYGFQLAFDPPLPFPSEEAYARLWVHDHLLFPVNIGNSTGGGKRPGGGAPLWVPLPPRALNAEMLSIEHPGSAPLSSYEVRLEYVCLAATGCGKRKISLKWATFAASETAPDAPGFAPIPATALLPTQSAPEAARRSLYARLQDGWGTYYHPGMLTWTLLPESFSVKVGLLRLSTNDFLNPEGLTINPGSFHSFVVRAGLHSYDNAYIEAAVTWRGVGGNINVSLASTVDRSDNSSLTLVATVNNPSEINASDYLLLLIPNFTHGRGGSVSADSSGVSGVSAGLRKSKLHLIQGTASAIPPRNSSGSGSGGRARPSCRFPGGDPVSGVDGYRHWPASGLWWPPMASGDHGPDDTNHPALSIDGTEDPHDMGRHSGSLAACAAMCESLIDQGCVGFTSPNVRGSAAPWAGCHLRKALVTATAGPGGGDHCEQALQSSEGWETYTRDAGCSVASNFCPGSSRPSPPPPVVPEVALGVSLATTVVLSTTATDTAAAVATKTSEYQAAEAQTLDMYGEWAEVKDAMQSSLMWSFIYDPKEGLVAPVTRNWGFGSHSIDGDQTEGLFCWDGSFASYMLSLDALDLAFSNLIQIVKMRTSAGFIPSYSAGTLKSRDRTNPPVTANILHKITQRWGAERTKWAVELMFDDLLNWNTWMFARRREAPLGLLSWGSNPYPYAPDGTGTSDRGTGGGGANLESGLDNSPVTEGVPFNETGLYLQDEYDAGYTGMFLMDCQAQMALAKMIGRTDAATTLQQRFDAVNAVLPKLWNASAGYYQNKRSKDLSPIARMAPTHFYPLLAGPADGPTEAQATTMIDKHMTNPARFAVWKSGSPPTDHPIPPEEARPLVQWMQKPQKGEEGSASSSRTLCCQLGRNFVQRGSQKLRYEAMGIGSAPSAATMAAQGQPKLTELFVWECLSGGNYTDLTFGAADWKPAAGAGGPCKLAEHPRAADFPSPVAMYVFGGRSGPSAADLVELEQWWMGDAAGFSDHYTVATAEGKADAAASGYKKVASLGWVWPAPGTANATSRYGLPSISKDDISYIDQDYWHGRTWSPMIQIVYWGLEQYSSAEAKGATAGLVAQSKAMLLKEWRGYGNQSAPGGSYAGSGRYVYENFGADTGEGYGYSSEAQPMYSWGALAGFVGLQANGFYDPLPPPS